MSDEKTKKLEELKKVKTAQKKLADETAAPKTYRINGQDYSQDFMTIDRVIRLGKMLEGIDVTQISGFWEALDMLHKAGKIQEFFEIILVGPKTDFTKAPAFVLMRAIKDFFSMNQLFEIMGEFASAMAIQQAAEGLIGTKLSPPLPKET